MKIDHQTHALLIRFVLAMLAVSYAAILGLSVAGLAVPAQIDKAIDLGWPALLGLIVSPKDADTEDNDAD